LHEIIENFATGTFIAGDAMLTEHLLVSFTGSCKQDPDKDSYNVYLSRLRIQIEMSFGLLTIKWHILKRKLKMSLENSARIIEACARMHNILSNCTEEEDEDEDCPKDKPEIHVMAGSPLGWGYLPTIEDFNSSPGNLHTRETVLRK
jgi:hypothetical protein